MKDFLSCVMWAVVMEVYTGSGVFLFSADTVREAMEELLGKRRLLSHLRLNVKCIYNSESFAFAARKYVAECIKK